MQVTLKDPWDRQLEVIAERMDCDPETALCRSLALALVVTWELSHEGTRVVFHAPDPRGDSELDTGPLYGAWSEVPPDVGLQT